MSQIAVRLTAEELRRLDSAVDAGSFSSRADAVRAGIRLLEDQLFEKRVTDSYRTAYTGTSLTDEEERMLEAAVALAGDALA
jgi:Arc/MetJ-type ribon-helix-helix transcriptional regulator